MTDLQERTPRLLKLVDYQDPLLRQIMEPVQFPLSEQDKQLIKDMKYSIQTEQLEKANAPWENAGGMAANQWGFNKQLFLFCPEGDPVDELEVIINPSYEPINASDPFQQNFGWEACFSVPLATGKVRRYLRVKVKYQNEVGETIERELQGWPARVWQHETDHLNGLLYDDPKAGKCLDKKQFVSKEGVDKFFDSLIKQFGSGCPCGSGASYRNCCAAYHMKAKAAPSPEALMRSRYTAYVKGEMEYIQHTMLEPALLRFNKQAAMDTHTEWLGLEVVRAYLGSSSDVGYVEFIAKYKKNNTEYSMHELSEFHYRENRWYYVDGEFLA